MNIFCYAFNWVKKLFTHSNNEIKNQVNLQSNNNQVNQVLLSSEYIPKPKFKIDLLISKLESYKDKKVFEADCKKIGVSLGEENYSGLNTDDQALKENLHVLFRVYTYQDDEHYQNWIDRRIKYYQQWDEEYTESYIEDLRKRGVLCSACHKGELKYYETGLADIEYDWYGGGPAGAGIHVQGHGHHEYQFHYKKCNKCGDITITEYREVPSWFDDVIKDIFNYDQPFHKGDLIEDFKNNKFSDKKYTSHKIIHW